MNSPNGAQSVLRTLGRLGVQSIFSVSGNQVLPLFEAAREANIPIVHTRHESAAVYAATAGACLSGKPGIALVSAGPGFLAGLTGLATARELESPVLYLSGDSPLKGRGTGHFQEFPQASITGAFCKAAIEVPDASMAQSALGVAWRLAQAGIPGPVHVALPVDVLQAQAPAGDAWPLAIDDAQQPASAAQQEILQAMAHCLLSAKRPLLIARPSAARGDSGRALQRLADHLGVLPIITESPRGLSDPKYAHLVPLYGEADAALVLAPSDFAVGYFKSIAPRGTLLHIRAERDPAGMRVADHAVQMDALPALAELAKLTESYRPDPEWAQRWSLPPFSGAVAPETEGLHPAAVGLAIRSRLRPDDIVVLDGGEFCQWVRLALRDVPNDLLWNSKLGGIGGAIPMALGAARTHTSRRVIAFLGDGCAGYHLTEFETAVRYGIPFTAIIGNDARWGAEWHMQRQRYDHVYETDLLPARYDQAAAALGAKGVCAESTAALVAALEDGESRIATCINVRIASVRSPAPPA